MGSIRVRCAGNHDSSRIKGILSREDAFLHQKFLSQGITL